MVIDIVVNVRNQRRIRTRLRMRIFIPMPKDRKDLDGSEDFTLVQFKDERPLCKIHGAMNKVSKEVWRCLAQYGRDDPKEGETIGKFRDRVCNACCLETHKN